MDKQINFYLGKENLKGFSGYLIENNFFLIIEIDQDYEKEKGNNLIFDFKEKLNLQKFISLQQFEDFIKKIIIENNLPAYFSLVAAFFKDKIVYLKTINYGKIFCKRGNQLAEIISGNQSASGYVNFDDIFILTTKKFTDNLEKNKDINYFLNHKNSKEIIEKITPILKDSNDTGLISLFIQIKKIDNKDINYSPKLFLPKLFQLKKIFDMNFIHNNLSYKKAITYFFLLIIFLIFIWSVFLGYQRRYEKEINKKIEQAEREILNKISQAEEISFLNMNQAKKLIENANNQLNNLKKEIKKKNIKIDQIEKKIIEKENEIIKKETKSYQEFYDLSFDRKEAIGDKFFLESDFLFIIDKKAGVIYKLSLEKKSLEKFIDENIKKAKIISSYDKKIYFFVDSEGVYELNNLGKIKKIIENDKEWGEIVDMSTYNGNIYLLDIKKDEVYKYLPTDKGFSEKKSYFKKGEAVDLTDANSLAIDSSLYISFSKSIIKLNIGVKESFKNNFPNDDYQIKKVYTNKEIPKVYVWDKKNGLIYILTKNGDYQEQISSEIIKSANDFVVYKNKIFFLNNNKIYFIQ